MAWSLLLEIDLSGSDTTWQRHWLDRAWVRFQPGLRIFAEGWGDEEIVRVLSETAESPPPLEPAQVTWLGPTQRERGGSWREGSFPTPAIPEHMPPETRSARFGLWLPRDANQDTPIVLHLAGVGDEGYRLRRHLARPLLRRGVGAVLLENPFYGARRPANQEGVALLRVSDQLVLTAGVVSEGCALLAWLRQEGYDTIGVTGYSMGGSHAGMVAAFYREPIAAVPCAAGLSPSPVFCEGMLSTYVAWDCLGDDQAEARGRLGETLDLGALGRFEPPVCPEAAVLLAGRRDGYVPPSSVVDFQRHWQGARLRWLPGGHISSFLTKRRAMATAVEEALAGLRARSHAPGQKP